MVVYIVGAGPGDPELITLKAKRLIKEADIIIYDRLINEEILVWAKAECKIVYMGKRDGESKSSQHRQKEINSAIIKYGRDYRVVRLKGGDPFIFGRGGEEALICEASNIKFELVPGISSFYAAPAYAGIPITHREYNSVFAVLTGHESIKTKSAIKWSALPETIIVLMGASNIHYISQKLINVGRDKSTPVAAIKWGTTPKQNTKITTLGKLAEGLEEITPPTIIIIGAITSLHYKLNWFEKKLEDLKDKKIIIARAKNHSKESEEMLKSYKIEPITMPLIEVVPRKFDLPKLNDYNALVFTSVEGVTRVGEKVDLNTFKGKIFAIGPKTRKLLFEKFKIKAYMGKKYNSEGLGKHIITNLQEGSKILLLRSSAATNELKNILKSTFIVSSVYLYDIKTLPADPNLVKDADVIFVMSASCAKSLERLNKEILERPIIVSIGPETSKHLTIPHLTSREYTFQGMLNTYLNYLWSEN
ncbi:MAG: uroporphyrinogen-III C-methyltransferase [Promethearchaeota archaeon]|jgi:uroporphyrinogen III methyltransferase/synthase